MMTTALCTWDQQGHGEGVWPIYIFMGIILHRTPFHADVFR